MSALVGKWKNTRDENFGEYLKALGIGTMKRVVIDKVHPDLDVEQNGDEWTIKLTSTFSTQSNTFTIGKEYVTDYKSVTAGTLKCMPTFDGSVLRVESSPIDADIAASTTIREIVGDELVQTNYKVQTYEPKRHEQGGTGHPTTGGGLLLATMICKGVTAKRYYARK